MTRTSLARLAAPLALVLTLAGCALNSPSVADISYNPGRYQDRTVSVEGTVTSAWGVPLVPFKLYKVDDGTGERPSWRTTAGHRSRDRASRSRAASATSPPSEARPSACTSSRRTSTSSDADRHRRPSRQLTKSVSQQEGQELRRVPENPGLLALLLVLRSLLRDPDDDGGHVVVWRGLAAPLGHGCEDRVDDGLGGKVARSADHFEQALRGEFLAGLVHRLEHAVRAEHEHVARLQPKRHFVAIDP